MAERARPNLKQMADRVLSLLEPEMETDGLDILDVRVFQGGGRLQVRIYLDLIEDALNPVGINLDQCARAGRSINMLMEEADLFSGQYVIEVSSPGIRRPLRLDRHFDAAVGQSVDLRVRQGNKSRRVRGQLLSFENNVLRVQPPSTDSSPELPAEVKILRREVMEANLDPEFNAKAIINEDRRQKKDDRREERSAKRDAKKKKNRPRKRPGNRKSSSDSEE
ncbi:MAG: hypothetical protein GY780_15385 [bacterium]|nr:hypothetical protein [bacterium]